MSAKTIAPATRRIPAFFDDFFKPWEEWFDNEAGPRGRLLSVPAVNITEHKEDFVIALAAPGLKKEDFRVDISGNMLTISAEAEAGKEETEGKYTRKEYNYTSFSRMFSLPPDVNEEAIKASYKDGILKLCLPKKETARQKAAKQISVE